MAAFVRSGSHCRTLRACLRALAVLAWLLLPGPASAQAPEIYLQGGFKTGNDFNGGQELAFSPDGSTLAAVSGGTVIRTWDTATGREQRTLTGHTDVVKCVAFLPDGKRLLSSGWDKTVRLWDLETGRLIRTLFGHKDSVRSIAVSADGTVAASIEKLVARVWDLESGALVATIPSPPDPGNMPGYITPFWWVGITPDSSKVLVSKINGEFMVVGVRERRVLETWNRDKLGIYWSPGNLGLAADGRMVLADTSALIHLDPDRGEGVRRKMPDVGEILYLSPDGSTLVGRSRKDQVFHVYDGEGKERLALPYKDGVVSWAFSPATGRVALSALGDFLKVYDLATGKEVLDFSSPAPLPGGAIFSTDGGSISIDVQLPLKGGVAGLEAWTSRWNLAEASLDGFSSLTAFHNEVMRMFAAGGEAASKASAMVKAQTALRVDRIYFSPYDPQNRCYWFVNSEPDSMISGSPYMTVFKIDAKGPNDFDACQSSNRPNWKVFKRFQAHASKVTAHAVTYQHNLVATGSTDRTINLFAYGSFTLLRTLKGHLGTITNLSFSPDGTRLLSQSEDLTTRLWDVATGRELGRFVRFNDGEWIVTTPEGYYNASPDGDRHLNVRVGTEVFGIDNYREAFFRPDLVKVALSGGSMEGYRTLAEIKPAPKVTFAGMPVVSAASEAKVTLRLVDRGGGIGDVRLFLNGSAVVLDNGRGLAVVGKEKDGAVLRSYNLKLLPGANIIRAAAFNADNSMQGNSASLTVEAGAQAARKPNLHALVVGIQEFRNPKLKLKYAVADAQLFADTLRKGAQGLFGQVRITTLVTREATTRDKLVAAMAAYKDIQPDDVFILYLASHGTVDDGEYFLITSNVGPLGTERLRTDALTQGMLKEMVANVPSTKKLIVIDTCNAGQMGKAMQAALLTRGMSEETAIKVLSRAVGSTILSASTSTQEALEGYKGHGLFTWTLTQGMLGKADKGGSGVVQTTELAAYVEGEVPDLAEKIFKHAQNPTVSMSGHGFPLSRVKQGTQAP